MPPNQKRPLTKKELVELVNIPDTSDSEDDLENIGSDTDERQVLSSNISGASSSSSSYQVPSTSTAPHQAILSSEHVIIDSVLSNISDEWSSSDDEPLHSRNNITVPSQNQELVHDDSELCISDHADSDDDTDDSDDDDTDWKKVNLEQLEEINKIFEEEGFDCNIYPTYFFSIVSPPLEYFERFFDSDIINLVAEQTNLYAKQKNVKNWTDTNTAEIKALLGLLILMSVHPMYQETQYWSSNPLYHVEQISNIMSLKRYKKLMECLHLNDNSKAAQRGEPGYDKLFKLRPLIDRLNSKFSEECTTSKSQSVDECMVKFKGRSSLKQYMPMKPVKRGYKVWARADSSTGYLYQFEIYCGKAEGVVEIGLGPNVVLRLTEDLKGKACHVAFDNFFTSVTLMRELYLLGIYSTGTVRKDRVGLPKIAKQKGTMTKHTSKWRVTSNTGYVQWKDSKPVYVLTTAFDPKVNVDVQRTQKDGSKALVKCPLPIAQYTKRMGGVDQFDQFRSHYKLGRRSNKWWMRLFYFLFESGIINAFILYKAVHKDKIINQLKFRERLAYGLIDGYTSRKRKADQNWKCSRASAENDDVSNTGVHREIRYAQLGVHWPEELPSFRRCHLCSTRTKNKRSRIRCSKCLVVLCTVPCFANFHKLPQ